MAEILITGLSQAVIDALQQRAEHHERSLEAEVRALLESFVPLAAGASRFDEFERADALRRPLARDRETSVETIRADRDGFADNCCAPDHRW